MRRLRRSGESNEMAVTHANKWLQNRIEPRQENNQPLLDSKHKNGYTIDNSMKSLAPHISD